jgi:hypothetical protein
MPFKLWLYEHIDLFFVNEYTFMHEILINARHEKLISAHSIYFDYCFFNTCYFVKK